MAGILLSSVGFEQKASASTFNNADNVINVDKVSKTGSINDPNRVSFSTEDNEETDIKLGNLIITTEHYVLAYADVNISTGTGWAQINKAPSKIWQSPDSSGNWTLKNTYQSVRNVKFPATSMGINITGLVEVSKSTSTSMGLSFTAMKSLGFNMSGTSSSSWYARKNYNSVVWIKTMG